jgi:RES domain-containing protein
MIRSWRLVQTDYAAHAFDGEGARLYGGRWNSPGRPAVYTAGSLALAALEVLVHLKSREALAHYLKSWIEFDESWITTVAMEELPRHWRQGRTPAHTQMLGDHWLEASETPVLQVPSVVIPEEWNYIINPLHPQFAETVRSPPQPFQFDPRLADPS